MIIKKEKNKLLIGGIERNFNNNIDAVLEFPHYCVVLLMDDDIPDNNVMAIGYNGDILWNISEIIRFKNPEAYITITKESENTFSAVTYNGVKFVIDALHNQIVNKEVTK